MFFPNPAANSVDGGFWSLLTAAFWLLLTGVVADVPKNPLYRSLEWLQEAWSGVGEVAQYWNGC